MTRLNLTFACWGYDRMRPIADGTVEQLLSMPEGEAWSRRTGFITDAATAIFGDKLKDMENYFAGPPAMATAVVKPMHEAKVPQTQVHYDQFY